MKKLFLFLFIGIFALDASSQMVVMGSAMDQAKIDSLDQATVRCYYVVVKRKTDQSKPARVDTMALDIGANVSLFYDPSKLLQDSLSSAVLSQINPSTIRNITVLKNNNAQDLSSYPGTTSEIRYDDGESAKFYKDKVKNEITVIDRMSYSYMYEDAIGILPWKIRTDTMTVLSHSCQKAELHFRGRDYIAWFSPDIPINDGPWKFMGLPGLILKVEDSQQLFSFEMIGIQHLTFSTPILMKKGDNIIKCSRKDYEKQKSKAGQKRQININGGDIIISELPGTKDKNYVPIELD